MREGLNEPVSVISYYQASSGTVRPYKLLWSNQEYLLGPIDFYHKTKLGTATIHHFSLSDEAGQVYFKLACDGSTLQWLLEEYMPADAMHLHYAKKGGQQ